MRRRVVVTGLGAVTPLGADVQTLWRRLLAGERAVGRPQRHGGERPPSQAVGEVASGIVDALAREHPVAAATGDLRTLFAFAAATEALRQAGLAPGDHPRAGVFLGTGPGAHRLDEPARWLDASGQLDARRMGRERDAIAPGSLLRHRAEQPSALVARAFGIGGPVHAVTTACSASNQALGAALRSIRRGETDWVLAGGADSMMDPLGLVFFVLLGASASGNGDPASACRPFDRRRGGLVMGEGAGCAVLEAEEHARARGATILAEAAGYGSSLDAYRTTAPPPDGRGAAEAMAYALADGDVPVEAVDFVNAHGTGTKRNDPAEIRAIRTVFGDHAGHLAVSSGKGALGHLLSAAAGVAFACCVMAVRHGAVPPTANLADPDPACDLDLVPDPGRRMPVRAALNNSFAFGGQNACLVVRRYEEGASA